MGMIKVPVECSHTGLQMVAFSLYPYMLWKQRGDGGRRWWVERESERDLSVPFTPPIHDVLTQKS